MIPVIALVGRSNVGKSSLFNRLTCTNSALIADSPGLTRDRKYGYAKWKNHEFIVIDTGGINNIHDIIFSEVNIESSIVSQSIIAIMEADVVLLIVDGRIGITYADQIIANYLRIQKKNIVVVVNKTDGINSINALVEFYALGISKDIIAISASHGSNINFLLEKILLPLINNNYLLEKEKKSLLLEEKNIIQETQKRKHFNYQVTSIKIAIVGQPNVGKSKFINCVTGKDRMIVCNKPFTTRDSIYISITRNKHNYILIDTAGVRKKRKVTDKIEKFSIIKTIKAIEDANVVLLIIDACHGISDQDLSLLNFILSRGRSLVIAINKCDIISIKIRDEIKKKLNNHLKFINFAKVHFISALHGDGVDNLFKSINETYQSATKKISTAFLTRIMYDAMREHQPPLIRGRRVKPKYAHIGGYNPPIIVIHGTQVKHLPDSYKSYLISYFRRVLKITGTPINIHFNNTINPFNSKHNSSTTTKRLKTGSLIKYKNTK